MIATVIIAVQEKSSPLAPVPQQKRAARAVVQEQSRRRRRLEPRVNSPSSDMTTHDSPPLFETTDAAVAFMIHQKQPSPLPPSHILSAVSHRPVRPVKS